jgi:hypothetical protein
MTAKTRALLGTLLLLAPSAASGDWKPIITHDGIEVSELEAPERSMPVFRGVGVIDASLADIVAVLGKIENHARWMSSCVEARLLRREGELVSYAYNRTDAPWPVADRDVVVRAETTVVVPGQEVHSVFRSVPDDGVPEARGVVRMPHLAGHWKLRALGAGRTRVEYQVDADPGGRLPKWLVRQASRNLPLETLQGLRKEVARVKQGSDQSINND